MPRRRIARAPRGRPTRDALTRERVLRAALELLDREGVEALTLRRLARHLGVTPMAIYNHVSNKRDLLRGVAEHLVAEIDFSCEGPDWQARVRACFDRLRRACLAHPGAVRLMEALDASPRGIFRPLEVTLAALEEAGLSASDALKGYFLLANFTMGQVSYEIRGPFEALDPADAVRHGRLHGPAFAHTRRAVSPEPWDFDRAFDFGLSTILAGLERAARRG